jgi:hypothetical protein
MQEVAKSVVGNLLFIQSTQKEEHLPSSDSLGLCPKNLSHWLSTYGTTIDITAVKAQEVPTLVARGDLGKSSLYIGGGDCSTLATYLHPLIKALKEEIAEDGIASFHRRPIIASSGGAIAMAGGTGIAAWIRDILPRVDAPVVLGRRTKEATDRPGGGILRANAELLTHTDNPELCPDSSVLLRYPGLVKGKKVILIPEDGGILIDPHHKRIAIAGETKLMTSDGVSLLTPEDMMSLVDL